MCRCGNTNWEAIGFRLYWVFAGLLVVCIVGLWVSYNSESQLAVDLRPYFGFGFLVLWLFGLPAAATMANDSCTCD